MATKTEHTSSPDGEEPTATIEKIVEQSQRIVTDFIVRQGDAKALEYDPLNIGSAFSDITRRMMADPARLARAQVDLWNSHVGLWQQTANRMMGQEAKRSSNPTRTIIVFRMRPGRNTRSSTTSSSPTC